MKDRIFSVRGGGDLFLVLLGLIFIHAGIGKVLAGQVPEWFSAQFEPTLIGSLPGGVFLSYWGVAIIEVVVGCLAFASLVRRQLIQSTFVLAEATFLALGFGLRLSQKYAEAGQLFNYFALTLILHILLSRTTEARGV